MSFDKSFHVTSFLRKHIAVRNHLAAIAKDVGTPIFRGFRKIPDLKIHALHAHAISSFQRKLEPSGPVCGARKNNPLGVLRTAPLLDSSLRWNDGEVVVWLATNVPDSNVLALE